MDGAISSDREIIDIAVVGAGAAGLMAAIIAGRTAREVGRSGIRIVAFDSARTLGAKILVAGGGRCNVTHHAVSERDYCGATPPSIRKVLARFPVDATRAFFRDLDVELKREGTGKLFPVTDSARTVLDALLRAARTARVEIDHPCRVAGIEPVGSGTADERRGGAGAASAERSAQLFRLVLERMPAARARGAAGASGANGAAEPRRETVLARRVVLATGGCSLPKSGSDGHGHVMARALGHSLTPAIFPALVPLVLSGACLLRTLSGLTLPARLTVVSGTGRHLASTENSTLITHFGLSGPSVLDISRHLHAARREDGAASLDINWLPSCAAGEIDAALRTLGKRSVSAYVRTLLPERLADVLVAEAGIAAGTPGAALTRTQRRALVGVLTAMRLPVTGDRGFTFAETTAGGVPLSEIDLRTMESRCCPGLFLIGEVLDVDGRIGGFNFQWAWASGFVAGKAAGLVS